MKNISIAILSIALVVSIFVYLQAQRSIEELKLELSNKQNVIIETKYQLLQTEYSLKKAKLELSRNMFELSSVNSQLSRAEREISSLEITSEKNKFHFYYIKPEQRFGVSGLASVVEHFGWLTEYERDQYDCTEMSASLEWILENQGFHTLIVAGESPAVSGVRHAWLLVETSPGKYTPVEATERRVVYTDTAYFDNYFKYERKFENIQEAMDYNPYDFDWWKS